MQTAISEEIFGLKFKYFTNDGMAAGCVGSKKEWEPHITKFTQVYNASYQTKNIIDIGANFGYHTLLFSRECSENVFAFEPQIQNFELLEENVKNNKVTNVVLYNHACGDQNCEVKMPIFSCTNTINMGDVTPNSGFTDNNYSIAKSVILDETNFPSKVDLIKLDVQGWEKKVLLGATHLLKTHKPTLIVEFEHFQLKKTNTTCKELFDFIREQDYYIFYLDYTYPSDHVCVHNDNLADFRVKFKNHILPHRANNGINNNVINGVSEKIVM